MKTKTHLILQLIKACSEYDAPVNTPEREQTHSFTEDILFIALRKLSNKELEKLITFSKNRTNS